MKKIILMIAFIIGGSYFFYGNAQGVGEFSYQASFPTGAFKDFVGKTSWVGFGFQGRKYLNDQLSLGGSFSWYYFPDKRGKQTVQLANEGGVYTGNQTNFTNIYGLLAIVQYDFKNKKEERVPFVRGGLGAAYQNQRTDIGLYAYKYDGVQFAMNVEAGMRFNYSINKGFVVAATYNYMPAASDMVATAFFGLKVAYTGFSH